MAQLDFIRSNDFDYSMKTGVTFLADLLIKDNSGVPMNLSGYTVSLYIYNYLTRIGTVVGTVTTPSSGMVHFEMSAENTALMPLGNFIYHMEHTIAGVVTRIAEGKLEIRD
jgi:hypothetical protein